MKYWFRIAIDLGLVALVLGLTPGVGAAERGVATSADRQALEQRLQRTGVFVADFTQSVFGTRGELLEQSDGFVRLQRPRFKWVVKEPYPQVLVTEGDRLKLYDPDLEQLTVRPLAEALKDTPVSLLTQDAVALGSDFNVLKIADADGESFVIEPTGKDTLYREILLHFGSAGLTGLDILDHLGQRTEVRFERISAPAAVDAAEFTLEVPPDTDVIGG